MYKKINIQIDVIFFKEDNQVIAFSPALELSTYGENLRDAKESFRTVFRLYLEETERKGTLIDDLLEHGWTIQTNPVPNFKPPKTDRRQFKSFDIIKEQVETLSIAC